MTTTAGERNHYEVLGLARSASPEVIKAAYRARTRSAHPDNGGDPDEMTAINHAWDILGDPDKRHDYDIELDRAQQARQSEPSPATTAAESTDPDDPFGFKNWQPDFSHFASPGGQQPNDAPPPAADAIPEDTPALAFFGSFFAGVALATIGVGWVIVIVVAGLIHHDGAASIFENVFVAALVFIATMLAIAGRVRRVDVVPPAFYAVVVLVLVAVGIVLRHELAGWAALTWALLTVCCAEGERFQRVHALRKG